MEISGISVDNENYGAALRLQKEMFGRSEKIINY